MPDEPHPITRFPRQRPPGVQLDSWKQIAGYLKRHVTTVRRWEQREGLPVHRHFHSKLGSIYADSNELDTWLETRRPDQPVPSGPKPVFGRAEVIAFERPSPPAVLPSWPGPFNGRDAELATLLRMWEAVRSGCAQLVLITGEPGIGKTRLATEFARSLGDRATVLTGRCEPEAIVPFAPFIEILRALVRGTPTSRLHPFLKSINGSAELVQLFPELANTFGCIPQWSQLPKDDAFECSRPIEDPCCSCGTSFAPRKPPPSCSSSRTARRGSTRRPLQEKF
jgi:hypothetical protein